MAQDIFLKVDGIDGESEDSAHKGEIDVLSWRWGITQDANMHSGSGGGAGKAQVSDLTFDHNVDRSTPNFMKMCMTGKHISEAVLTIRKAGGEPLEYLKITMNDIVVTGVSLNTDTDDPRARETISLSFAKVKQEYMVQNITGGSGGAVTAGYDIKGNKEA